MLGAELTHHFLISAILTALVAMFVLWRYRVAVLDGMMRGDGTALPLPLPPALRAGAANAAAVNEGLAWERRMQRRIALAYFLTTLLCALPLALASRYLSDPATTPAEYVAFALIYTFACVPMIAAALALPLSITRVLAGVALLVTMFLVVAFSVMMIQRGLAGRPVGWQQLQLFPILLKMAANELWQPALLWLLTWPKRLRGVVPITFAALLIFGLAPLLGLRMTSVLASTQAGTPLVLSLGLNGMFMLIALPVGWVAWKRLHQVARGYDAKQFSDTQLLSRAWWVMLVATVGLTFITVTERWGVMLAVCLAVALAFAPVNRWLLARTRPKDGLRATRTLLLLRVFGYTKRTERLFDRIGARWRLFGPVTMIAAPDVAARTIDPGDYLRWLTGRVDEMFVTSRADLDERLAALDLARDPDGRYRVNEFCCRDNTWQATVVELIQRADAVVMDLRGVTRARRGCEFELQQLAQRLAPQRLVLVTDVTTDRSVLQDAFGAKLDEVRVIDMRASRDADAVFDALLAAAA
jgi:hypothetical protein